MLELGNLIGTSGSKLLDGSMVGNKNNQGSLDSQFLALLGNAKVNTQAALDDKNKELEAVMPQPDNQQNTEQDKLASQLQNDLTLLFSSSKRTYLASTLTSSLASQQISDNLAVSDITLSTFTQGTTNTNEAKVKVTVKWGLFATGHLAQYADSNSTLVSEPRGVQGSTADVSNKAKLAVTENTKTTADLQGRLNVVLSNAQGYAQLASKHFDRLKTLSQEIAKPFFDIRYQPYSAQALHVLVTQKNDLKVSARDFFSQHEHGKAIQSWLTEMVDEQMLAKIKEYSFNGVTVWTKEGENGY